MLHGMFDLQGHVVCYHDFVSVVQHERDRRVEAKFLNQVGGRLQLAVNPELATKSKYIRNKVNLIVCKKQDFKDIVQLFVDWRCNVTRMKPLEERKSQLGFTQEIDVSESSND